MDEIKAQHSANVSLWMIDFSRGVKCQFQFHLGVGTRSI